MSTVLQLQLVQAKFILVQKKTCCFIDGLIIKVYPCNLTTKTNLLNVQQLKPFLQNASL